MWFSLWAWVRAKAASKAAQAAREAILLRTLAEELQATCDKLDDLMDLIEHDRFDQARWITREVAAALSELHIGEAHTSARMTRTPYSTKESRLRSLRADSLPLRTNA